MAFALKRTHHCNDGKSPTVIKPNDFAYKIKCLSTYVGTQTWNYFSPNLLDILNQLICTQNCTSIVTNSGHSSDTTFPGS